MPGDEIKQFSRKLGECRTKPSLSSRMRCEEGVGEEVVEELYDRGVITSKEKNKLGPEKGKALVRSLDKTGQGLKDVDSMDRMDLGVWYVDTDDGTGMFMKKDSPKNIVLTKQVRNVTDVVEDDSTTVLHQDLNDGVVVMSDEGTKPRDKDISGVEAGMAAVSEALIMDNDRKDLNLAYENNVLSEIDFEASLIEKFPPEEIGQLLWTMNDVTAERLATVLQCGGWSEAYEASENNSSCVVRPVTPKFKAGVQAGLKSFDKFKERKDAPEFDEMASMLPQQPEERLEPLREIAFGDGDVEYYEEDLEVL